jgi:hypothetical protein
VTQARWDATDRDSDSSPAAAGRLGDRLGRGLAADAAYLADLEQEIVATHEAYVAAAVIEIAVMRADTSGRQTG